MSAIGPEPGDPLLRALPADLAACADRVATGLQGARGVAVAFSGGVDSSVVVALAARALGRARVVAVLGVSPSLSDLERRQARSTARVLGVRLVEVPTFELDDPDYVANRGNRCYFCKHELYTRAFGRGLAELGCDVVVNGDTADDLRAGHRPGRRAATELGVGSPLAAAGIGKAEVRALARALDLPVWDKPSSPCLASRVPVHTLVTREVLGRIERAEAGLRGLGLREVRVRHHGGLARLEAGVAELAALADHDLRGRALAAVTAAGYDEVELVDRPLERG